MNRRKWTIVVVTSAVVLLTLAYCFKKTPVYTANAQVLIPTQSATAALNPVGQTSPGVSNLQRTLSDAQQFAQGDQTKAAARAILHRRAKVTVSASSTADVLTFTASNTDKATAARTANAYAQAFITASRANQVAQYTGQVQALQASITKLQSQANTLPAGSTQQTTDQSSITSLTQALQQLQAASELATQTSPTVVNAATIPTHPSSPKTTRDLLLALVVGLLLGAAVAFLQDRLDDKISSMSDVEAASAGRPVVGVIPMVDGWRKGTTSHVALIEDPASAVAEAYRTLRTSIQFLGLEDTQHVIGITSSTPDEGKSTATSNLAVSFARAGQRVIVMSCDFRRPRIHTFFGLDNSTGATSILLEEATLRDALRAVDGEPNLRVLPSGPIPPNPAEILSLDRVRQLVDVLADNADLVLLDCPPVLPVTDALLISRLCDTMLVLTLASATKKNDLTRTYELLDQVKAPVRGTVVNQVPAERRGGYHYGYGYTYGYRYSEPTPAEAPTNRTRSNGTSPATPRTRPSVTRPEPFGARTTGSEQQPTASSPVTTLDDF